MWLSCWKAKGIGFWRARLIATSKIAAGHLLRSKIGLGYSLGPQLALKLHRDPNLPREHIQMRQDCLLNRTSSHRLQVNYLTALLGSTIKPMNSFFGNY